ncbi:terminase large subunit domain-containing protein [Luteimicrobium sp. NPDC057192]|uniref:terminase large subunit domain-containing protein n=1 Tax=Luteimicrobium sp. NPDC057192 TaxID=3346042 RepID=UPI0036308A43
MTLTAPAPTAHPTGLARPPRFYTRRNPRLRTRGRQVAAIAAALGRPLLPWQQYVADVATELNPPGHRLRYRYQTVVVAVPRQAGKTTLLRPIVVDRAITRDASQIFTTAQLGKDAGARWDDLIADVENGPLKRFVDVKRGKGSQRATFPNGSYISPFAPTRDSLHGYSPDLVLIDEGWAFSREAADELMAAIRPAMITRRDRQLYVISAAGDATSEYWNDLVDAGRLATLDPDSTTAYFEWSPADELDPYDPATWEYHPGLDRLVTIDDLATESKPENNTHANFLRMYLNRRTRVESTILDLEFYDTLATEQAPPAPERVAYGYDVALDRTQASVWAAWLDDAGVVNLHLRETREGADWLVPYVTELYTDGAATIGADDGGPARIVTAQLKHAGVPVQTVGGRDGATAWGQFKALVKDSTPERHWLIHDADPAMRSALEVAAERTLSDVTVLSRRDSLGPIDPLVAGVTAAWLAAKISPLIQIF